MPVGGGWALRSWAQPERRRGCCARGTRARTPARSLHATPRPRRIEPVRISRLLAGARVVLTSHRQRAPVRRPLRPRSTLDVRPDHLRLETTLAKDLDFTHRATQQAFCCRPFPGSARAIPRCRCAPRPPPGRSGIEVRAPPLARDYVGGFSPEYAARSSSSVGQEMFARMRVASSASAASRDTRSPLRIAFSACRTA